MSALNSRVAAILRNQNWLEERKLLRDLLLDSHLDEAVKWGKLCYTWQGGNVAIIFGLKKYCAISFFKGSLLQDPAGILIAPGKHSQAMRQIRFASIEEIVAARSLIQHYIQNAINLEQAGLKVEFKEKEALQWPEELKAKLEDSKPLKSAFEKLTPGRQRGYILHIAGAKKSETRISRVDKCAPKILKGIGLNER